MPRLRYLKSRFFVDVVFLLTMLSFLLTSTALTEVAFSLTIDFEDLGVPFDTQINPPDGVGVVTGGFNYTPGPINDAPFNQLYISNQQDFWSFNGSTVGGTNDDVVLTQVGNGLFELVQFDFAGFPTDSEIPFSVVGTRGDLTTVTNDFTPDGLTDGPGGVEDFQTFTVVGDWTNLVSVHWSHFGAGTIQGLFALDNIVVNIIPEPTTLALAGLGLSFIAMRRRR